MSRVVLLFKIQAEIQVSSLVLTLTRLLLKPLVISEGSRMLSLHPLKQRILSQVIFTTKHSCCRCFKSKNCFLFLDQRCQILRSHYCWPQQIQACYGPLSIPNQIQSVCFQYHSRTVNLILSLFFYFLTQNYLSFVAQVIQLGSRDYFKAQYFDSLRHTDFFVQRCLCL